MAMAMPHEQQAWSSGATWRSGAGAQSCGGNTWSKRLASAMDNDSWEVRAFAEDASSSGQWPPRSYSCSFCQREFRTAQALGGHMNVHRRERAHANQLAQERSAAAAPVAAHRARSPAGADDAADPSWLPSRLPPLPTPPRAAEFFSPQSLSLSMSGPTSPLATSPESISSSSMGTTKPLFQSSIPDILCESLSSARAFHPFEKSRPCKADGGPVNLGRFSSCPNTAMGEHEGPVVDLELRLGQSSRLV